jgi:hypothetical protein
MADKPLQAQLDTIRLPIYDVQRNNQAGYTTNNYNQAYCNCWPEIYTNNITGEKESMTRRREGIVYASQDIYATTGSASGREKLIPLDHISISQLYDVFVSAWGDITANKIYIMQHRPNANTVVKIGEISTTTPTSDFVFITEFQQNVAGVIYPSLLVSWMKQDLSSSKGFYAISDGVKFTVTTLTEITNVGFPPKQTPALCITGPFQQMNGKIYIMTTNGQIWNSGWNAGANTFTPNDATIWSTLTNISCYQSPDLGVGVYRYKHHIVGYGKDSIEFFNDVGTGDGSVTSLERTDQAFIKFGTPSPKHVCNVDDTLYWIGYSSTSTNGQWKLEGYTPVKMSGVSEDNIIRLGLISSFGSSEFCQSRIFPMFFGQQKHIGFTFGYLYMPWFANNIVGGTIGQSGDSYYSSPTGVASSTNSPSILFYNISSKVYWGFQIATTGTNLSNYQLYPAIYQPALSTSSYQTWSQSIFLMGYQVSGDPSCYVFSLGGTSTFYDDNPAATSGVPYPCAVSFNLQDFGNEFRKRINRATINFNALLIGESGKTNSVNLLYVRDPGGPASTAVGANRGVQYTGTASLPIRFYYNNLGSARRWAFCVYTLNKDTFQMKSLELNIEQNAG